MASEKKVKRVVGHPRLYLSVGGKLQRVPEGTEVTVAESQGERLGKKLTNPGAIKKVEPDDATKGDDGDDK